MVLFQETRRSPITLDTIHPKGGVPCRKFIQPKSFCLTREVNRQVPLSNRLFGKCAPFKNTIGGRSRGVRQVGGAVWRVFEKEQILCGKRKMSKTTSKCETVTQVVSRATSYDDEDRKKKVLTPTPFWPAVSNGKWWRNVADFWPIDLSNGGPKRVII